MSQLKLTFFHSNLMSERLNEIITLTEISISSSLRSVMYILIIQITSWLNSNKSAAATNFHFCFEPHNTFCISASPSTSLKQSLRNTETHVLTLWCLDYNCLMGGCSCTVVAGRGWYTHHHPAGACAAAVTGCVDKTFAERFREFTK